ncbi:hypothetical protein SCA6_005698 [Theobroma cacao]
MTYPTSRELSKDTNSSFSSFISKILSPSFIGLAQSAYVFLPFEARIENKYVLAIGGKLGLSKQGSIEKQ